MQVADVPMVDPGRYVSKFKGASLEGAVCQLVGLVGAAALVGAVVLAVADGAFFAMLPTFKVNSLWSHNPGPT